MATTPKIFRIAAGLAAGVLLLGGLSLGVTAASAAGAVPVLPDGWTMYAVDCDSKPGQLYSLNTATGVATAVGNPATNGNPSDYYCAGQGTYDPVTQKSYFPNWGPTYTLATANLTTGAFTNIVADAPKIDCVLTADSAGTVYTVIREPSAELSTVNLSTGAVTRIAGAPTLAGLTLCAVAWNPKDDKIYSFKRDSSSGKLEIVQINKSTGAVTQTGRYLDESATGLNRQSSPDSMAVDTNGIAWIQDDSGTGDGLIAVNLATGETWVATQGFFNVDLYPNSTPAGAFYTMSIWLAPSASPQPGPTPPPSGEQLASTGADSVLLAVAGISLLLVGFSFMGKMRRKLPS